MNEAKELPSTSLGQTGSSAFPWLLMFGDWLVLLLLVVVGQQDHNMLGSAMTSLLITTLSLAVPWTIVSWLLGGYRPQTAGGLWPWIGRCLTIWLVAAPLGLILRAVMRGQSTIILVFMIILMAIGALFILGWRSFYWWLWSRRSSTQVTV